MRRISSSFVRRLVPLLREILRIRSRCLEKDRVSRTAAPYPMISSISFGALIDLSPITMAFASIATFASASARFARWRESRKAALRPRLEPPGHHQATNAHRMINLFLGLRPAGAQAQRCEATPMASTSCIKPARDSAAAS